MKYRENTRNRMDMRAKVIIILSLIVCFFVILVPIWQKGVTRKNHYELLIAEDRLESMEEEERSLVAYILEKGNDTAVVREAVAGV